MVRLCLRWIPAGDYASGVRMPAALEVVASWNPSSPRPIIAHPTRLNVPQYSLPHRPPSPLPPQTSAAHAPESHLPRMAGNEQRKSLPDVQPREEIIHRHLEPDGGAKEEAGKPSLQRHDVLIRLLGERHCAKHAANAEDAEQ